MSRVAEAIEVARRVFGLRRPADPTGEHGRLDGRVRQVRRRVTDPAECDFYHVVELPGGELTKAQWDLRETADQYLGGVDFAGKRVLEIGPASGFLSFHMERRGARVFCVEPGIAAGAGERGAQAVDAGIGEVEGEIGLGDAEQDRGAGGEDARGFLQVSKNKGILARVGVDRPGAREIVTRVGGVERQEIGSKESFRGYRHRRVVYTRPPC